jgi:hypothetical protein
MVVGVSVSGAWFVWMWVMYFFTFTSEEPGLAGKWASGITGMGSTSENLGRKAA